MNYAKRVSNSEKARLDHSLVPRLLSRRFAPFPNLIAPCVPPSTGRQNRLIAPLVKVGRPDLGYMRAERAMDASTPYAQEQDLRVVVDGYRRPALRGFSLDGMSAV